MHRREAFNVWNVEDDPWWYDGNTAQNSVAEIRDERLPSYDKGNKKNTIYKIDSVSLCC